MVSEKELLELSNKLWDRSREDYEEAYDDEDQYKDLMDYRQLHSKIVADLAIKFFDQYYNDLFEDDWCKRTALYFGGLTHDIKKISEKHNVVGAVFVKEALDSSAGKVFDNEIINDIYTIIKYHKAKKEKKKDFKYMDEIDRLDSQNKTVILFIRIADKLSKLVYKSNYKEIHEKDVDEKMFKIIGKSMEFIWDKREV